MSQVYHSNAKTNSHLKEMIRKSNLTNVELTDKYNVNVKTYVMQWNKSCISQQLIRR
jgi:hypothetical protein